MEKTCTKCGETKSIDAFSLKHDKTRPNRRRGKCKPCWKTTVSNPYKKRKRVKDKKIRIAKKKYVINAKTTYTEKSQSLADVYVRKLVVAGIRVTHGIICKYSEIPQDLVILKKKELLLKKQVAERLKEHHRLYKCCSRCDKEFLRSTFHSKGLTRHGKKKYRAACPECCYIDRKAKQPKKIISIHKACLGCSVIFLRTGFPIKHLKNNKIYYRSNCRDCHNKWKKNNRLNQQINQTNHEQISNKGH
jgi:hypothetical protein